MKGIIWGETTVRANSKLQQIMDEYENYKIANLVRWEKLNSKTTIQYDNGDTWIALRADENRRGQRCNVSYIDTRIDPDIIQQIIIPCTTAAPFRAIQYFN